MRLQLEACNSELENIKNTAEKRLITAKKLEINNEHTNALQEYKTIIALYPDSEEAKIAKTFIDKREKLVAEQKAEEERLVNLGFKALKEVSVVKENNLVLSFSNAKIANSWITNRYENRYFISEAQRDQKYITITLKIESKSKEPYLPPVLAYKLKEGRLELIEAMQYQFFRWKNYSTYLGNYLDKQNDFNYSKNVDFTLGLEIDEDILSTYPIFLLVPNMNYCVSRNYDRFKTPTVYYSSSHCTFDKILDVNETSILYNTVKIFNRNKI